MARPLFGPEASRLGGLARGRQQQAKTHCPHGHEYTAENTIREESARGWRRRCRTCHNALARAEMQRIRDMKKGRQAIDHQNQANHQA